MADEDAEESEPEMDDESMFQLDQIFANIMRARKAVKNKMNEDVDPRNRVLQLLSVYCSFKDADSLLVLAVVLPIMRVANEKDQGSQRQKHALTLSAVGRILHLTKVHRKVDPEAMAKQITKEELFVIFKELVAETGKVHEIRLFQQFSEGISFDYSFSVLPISEYCRPDLSIF